MSCVQSGRMGTIKPNYACEDDHFPFTPSSRAHMRRWQISSLCSLSSRILPQPLEIATLNPAPLIVPILPAGSLILPDRRPRRRGAGRRACAIERRPVPGACVIAGPPHDLGRGQRQEAEVGALVARDHRPQDRGCVFDLAPQRAAGARIMVAVKVWCWQTQAPAIPRSGSGRGMPRRTSFASSADMMDRGTM